MTQEELEIANKKAMAIDLASYEMFEKTKRETTTKMREKHNADGTRMYSDEKIEEQIQSIQAAQDDVVRDYLQRGGKIEDFQAAKKKSSKPKAKTSSITDIMKQYSQPEPVSSVKSEPINIPEPQKPQYVEPVKSETETERVVKTDIDIIPKRGTIGNGEFYDVIPLPSNGECYKSKLSKIPVAFLTANDENMIVSPNLYRDNKIIDAILEQKILNNTIEPADLLEGDREAIILFLRANGYGVEYPITATDDKTGEEFDTVVDLSKISFKPFNLKGDANGWFDYTLPVSKHEVKFRFLTHRDNLMLQKLEEKEVKSLQKGRIDDVVEKIESFLDEDEVLTKTEKVQIREAVKNLNAWSSKLEDSDNTGEGFSHAVTNRLEACIMSVDGITNRDMIRDFVLNMNVKDSSSLRKYINENEPGLDYKLTIEKPQSLGGGSMDVFLQLDQFVFLNIA